MWLLPDGTGQDPQMLQAVVMRLKLAQPVPVGAACG